MKIKNINKLTFKEQAYLKKHERIITVLSKMLLEHPDRYAEDDGWISATKKQQTFAYSLFLTGLENISANRG